VRPTVALIDSGPLMAYYNRGDKWHLIAQKFFEKFKGILITSEPVVTEVMYLLEGDRRVQNEFLSDLSQELYSVKPLVVTDFRYIAELNEKYQDLPGDFADLSIVALATRLDILNVISLDADFDVYRSFGKRFTQLFPKWEQPA
jgi:uncharacterized protein